MIETTASEAPRYLAAMIETTASEAPRYLAAMIETTASATPSAPGAAGFTTAAPTQSAVDPCSNHHPCCRRSHPELLASLNHAVPNPVRASTSCSPSRRRLLAAGVDPPLLEPKLEPG
ncbi:hypothetical protein M0R45_019528 [Rubus argutus]|uniref:Antifreeze protein n=1 Tax=Rubus argutus TaxID=59490 RepID=A0AAW1X639_RUBAR